MKAFLVFNLPEDKDDFTIASKAGAWYSVVWDVDQELRKHLKYGHKFQSVEDALEDVRQFLHEAMFNNGCSFEEVS